LIAVVPILIAYIFLQRWLVGGTDSWSDQGLSDDQLDAS
jgi:ABC-type maltose transport system permease subunit